MSFSSPWLLLLFLLLPLILWLGLPSRVATRLRDIISLVLRVIIFASLVLSLAGLQTVRAADNLAVTFLIDVSDSMPKESKVFAVQWVGQALQTMGNEDKAAVVLFGGEALVERVMSTGKRLDQFSSVPTTIATDLGGAIRLALALFPAQAAKRIVILSDGKETTGDAAEAARLAAAAGVEIVSVPITIDENRQIKISIDQPQAVLFNETLITSVNVPSALRQNETFNIAIAVDSPSAQTAGVRVFAGSQLAYEGKLELQKGLHNYTIALKAGSTGFVSYRVQITPEVNKDTFFQNNEASSFSLVKGPPRVLVITAQNKEGTDDGVQLVAALKSANIDLDRASPAALPSEMTALAQYASVVLVNVPARDLSNRQQQALERYVRDLGGGLVVIGGPQSYGVGGYFRTPLETVLPVEMQLKDKKRKSRVTMIFIIDHSGSMSESSGGVQKIELAKEAGIRAVELLSPFDKVGVIQFDDTASWVVPITTLDDPASIINRIASIRSSGGTDIMSGVKAMASELPKDDSNLKHVILLTDGQANPTGIPDLVKQLYEQNGITMSTVAVGKDADQKLLQQLAQAGAGRYHFAQDPSTIPEIFAEETTLATRSYIIEETFFPDRVAPSPILQGINSVPQLLGYVGTSPKQTAHTILVSHLADGTQDPILASWQYGLGRAVAWTSDATGRWAKSWVTWDGYPTLFAQMVRYTISEGAGSDITANVTLKGNTASLAVDAFDRDGNFINNLTLQANVVAPDGTTQVITMTQSAPGRYEAEFKPTTQGAYLIRVGANGGAEVSSLGQTTGWVLPYSPEYKSFGVNAQLLFDLGRISGACKPNASNIVNITDCLVTNPNVAFNHNLAARNLASPLWQNLLLLAAFLLPFDIAARRLAVSRRDFQQAGLRAANFIRNIGKPRQHESTESMSRLKLAKQRAVAEGLGVREKSESITPPESAATPPIQIQPSTAVEPTLLKPEPVSAESPKPEPAPQPTAQSETTSTASALLAKKRQKK